MFERKVDQLTRSGIFLQTFDNATLAAKAVGKKFSANISATCRGERKSSFGYCWRYSPQPDLEGEEWRTHPTLNLNVSTAGRIENKRGRRTYGSSARNGYMNYMEKGKSTGVHRLVAQTFMPEQISEVVHHLDRNRSNNLLSNLEWTTQRKNVQAYHALIPKLY